MSSAAGRLIRTVVRSGLQRRYLGTCRLAALNDPFVVRWRALDDATATEELDRLADWVDDTAAFDGLVAELVAAYENVEDDDEGDEVARMRPSEDLAETTVDTVRWYLRS